MSPVIVEMASKVPLDPPRALPSSGRHPRELPRVQLLGETKLTCTPAYSRGAR